MGRYLYKNLAQLDAVLKDHPDYRLVSVYGGCVGASGALFGVMAAAAMAFPNSVISLLFPPISLRMKTFIWVYALLEIVMAFDSHSNVAHLAHLGGMVGAFIYMRRLRRGEPGRGREAPAQAHPRERGRVRHHLHRGKLRRPDPERDRQVQGRPEPRDHRDPGTRGLLRSRFAGAEGRRRARRRHEHPGRLNARLIKNSRPALSGTRAEGGKE